MLAKLVVLACYKYRHALTQIAFPFSHSAFDPQYHADEISASTVAVGVVL